MSNRGRKAKPQTKPYDVVGKQVSIQSVIESMDNSQYKQMLLHVSKSAKDALKTGYPPPIVGE